MQIAVSYCLLFLAQGIIIPYLPPYFCDLGFSGEQVSTVNRVRKSGGGRKRTVLLDPRPAPDLDRLIEPATRGDPSSPLRWSCVSTRTLARELMKLGHKTSPRMVAQLLHEMGYSLQANRKTREDTTTARWPYVPQVLSPCPARENENVKRLPRKATSAI